MPIDPNIILGLKPLPALDPSQAMEKAQTLKGMQQQAQLRDQQIAQNDMIHHDAIDQKWKDLAADTWMGVNDENSYHQAKQSLLEAGAPNADKIPDAYDPEMVKRFKLASIGHKQAQEQQNVESNLAMREREIADSRAERRYNAGLARQDRQDLLNEKRDEKDQALATPFGKANTADDAKQLKEAFESKQNFDQKIDEMIKLRKEYGGEVMNREAVARGKQLSKDLLLEYKNMAKLGVLSKSDEDIINAIIPDDPLAFRNPVEVVQGQDSIRSNLEKFKADKDADFKTRVATRTRAGIGTAALPKKNVGGKTYVKVDGGWKLED